MKTPGGKLTRSLGLLALAGGLGLGLTALDGRPGHAEEGKFRIFLGPEFDCSSIQCLDASTQECCLVDPLKPIIVVVDGGG